MDENMENGDTLLNVDLAEVEIHQLASVLRAWVREMASVAASTVPKITIQALEISRMEIPSILASVTMSKTLPH